MAVIHGVVGIASGADIRAGGEAGGPAVTKMGVGLSTVQPQHRTAGTDPRHHHRDPRGGQGTGSSPPTHTHPGGGGSLQGLGFVGLPALPTAGTEPGSAKGERRRLHGTGAAGGGGGNRGVPAPPAAGPGAPGQPQASPGPEAAQARP